MSKNRKNTSDHEEERPLPFVVVNLDELSPAEEEFGERFDARLVGQPEARQIALDVRTAYKNPIRNKKRPLGIYYLVGKSRRGKSLLAQVLAYLFHGDPEALTRLTAEDYSDDSDMHGLIGAPPRYVSWRKPISDLSKLTREQLMQVDGYSVVTNWNRVRVRINSKETIDVVVLEEFEKADGDFYKFWMEVFDKGKKVLANGEVADFTNTVFIITSNLAMDKVEKEERGGIGFNARPCKLTHDRIVHIVDEEMRRRYKPEFRNRLDGVVVYRELGRDDVRKIVDVEISLLKDRIIEQMPRGSDFTLEVETNAGDFLLMQAKDEVAELKRVIARHLEKPLGRMLDEDNPDRVLGGDLVKVSWDGKSDKLTFAVARGAGDFAESIEGLVLYGGDTPETAHGMAFQRRVEKARMKARRERMQEWSLILTANTMDEFADESAALLHDLERQFEVEVTDYSVHKKAPYSLSVTVICTEEQIGLIRTLYPDISSNPINKALVPVKGK
ncbi:MAG TPA: AAA family ATPase [Candidatus Obscuribacterales bacterium]